MSEPRFIVSLGDVNGVGPEILLRFHKAHPERPLLCVGDRTALLYWSRETGIPCEFTVVDLNIRYHPEPGKISSVAGEAAAQAVEIAYEEAKRRGIPLVTLPLAKEAVSLSRPGFTGHTELLARLDGKRSDEVAMVLGGTRMMVLPLTRHIPLAAVPSALSIDLVVRQVTLVYEWLHRWKKRPPKVWMAGLNPHAGEGGTIGTEEIAILVPAIALLRQKRITVEGPFPADTFFAQGLAAGVDLFVGCYHDQVLAPFKMFAFHEGINVTVGLSIVRTSPDHGTAFDIAGKGLASEKSFTTAVQWALEMVEAVR